MPKGKPNAKFQRFNQSENALDYLRKTNAAVRAFGRDPVAWKWALLSLHGAVYGYAIEALQAANPDRVMVRVPDGSRVSIPFSEAVKRIADPGWMATNVRSSPWRGGAQPQSALSILDQYVAHFLGVMPSTWVFEEHDALMACIDALEVVRFLVVDSNNVLVKPGHRSEVITLVRTTTEALKRTQLYRDHVSALRKLQKEDLRIHAPDVR